MDKAEIEKVLDETIWTTIGIQDGLDKLGRGVRNESIRDATSSLTALTIKWLEGKKQKQDWQGSNADTSEVTARNQLITELIGEVR